MDHPYLTAAHPGVGGVLRREPEDFRVTEIPAYEPCGSGEHLYLWIQKRGVGAEYFLKLLSRKLGLPEREIGVAGLKDRHAVTTQWVSVPAAMELRLAQIDGDGLTLLKTAKHTNKLRAGHLHGNRFEILIRDAAGDAEPILSMIREQGLPNYYGPQRFGHDNETSDLGMKLLAGERVGRLPPFKLKLVLSAAQSLLFNECLTQRRQDGLLRTVLDGDVMMKWPAGGMFVTEDPATERARFDAREIVTGGPIFGTKMFASKNIAAEREARILQQHQLTIDSFRGFGQLLSGTRRHNLIYIEDLQSDWTADGLTLRFSLPAGSYATVLLAEVMKKSDAALGLG